MSKLLALGMLCVTATSALAGPRFIDDRSSAEALVQSLYNAVNRKEYARAWDYFSKAPATSFDLFVAGYKDTVTVDVLTGTASSEGAAGTSYFEVPVALRTIDAKGVEVVYVGCYTLSQTNQIEQDPPFQGLKIVKGDFKPVKDAYFPTAVPSSCGDGAVPSEKDTLLEKVQVRYENEQAQRCQKMTEYQSGTLKPEVFELRWREKGALPEQPDNTATLFQFECDMGAYNSVRVYYMHDGMEGLRQLFLPVPDINYEYQGEGSAKLKAWQLRGITTRDRLINADFDPKTAKLFEWAKWRGVGDAFSNTSWVFRDGNFVLADFSVDPTYDDQMTPLDVFKNGLPVAVKSP